MAARPCRRFYASAPVIAMTLVMSSVGATTAQAVSVL